MILVMLALLAGCDDPAPETRLVFPPPSAVYNDEALRFRGEVIFNATDSVAVSVTGEGLVAEPTILNDAANTFEIEVSLSEATVQNVSLVVENLVSNVTTESPVRIDRNVFALRSTAIVALVDGQQNVAQLVISDARLKALVTVDPLTGERRDLSSSKRGLGSEIQVPIELAEYEGLLYLLDRDLGVLRVDPVSGDRVLLSGSSIGEGVAFVSPQAMAIRQGEIIVADIGLDALVRVDMSSGDRQIVFQTFVAEGPVVLSPRDMAFSPVGQLLIADDSWRAIFSVDLATGLFDVVANFEVGDGIPLAIPRALLVTTNNNLLVLDGGREALISVDAQSGDRLVIADNENVSGPHFETPVDAVLVNNVVYVTDNGSNEIYAINLSSGDRTLISDVRQGQGEQLQSPFDIVAFDDGYLLTDSAADSLIEIDAMGDRSARLLSTSILDFPGPDYINTDGRRVFFSFSLFDSPGIVLYLPDEDSAKIIAAPGIGSGPLFILPTEPHFRAATNELLVFDAFEQRLVALNLDTLVRRVLFDDEGAPEVAFRNVTSTSRNSEGQFWYLLDSVSSRILSLDIDTGVRELLLAQSPDRSLVDIETDGDRILVLDQATAALLAFSLSDRTLVEVSGENTGRGPAFERPIQMTINSQDQLAVVVDEALDAVFVVDLTSGDRVILSH